MPANLAQDIIGLKGTQEVSFLKVTDQALAKIDALIQEEANPHLMLRVSIAGGGCSGFQYQFSFDKEKREDDWVIEKSLEGRAVRIVIDALSASYLMQAEIDYKSDLQGERFIIVNPNAKTTCGCGSSFSV